MLKRLKMVYPIGVLVMFAMLMISCSKDRDEDATYNARLEVSYNGDFIEGNVFYNDENGVKKTLPLKGHMSEKITFAVKKGHQSYVEIDAKQIKGQLTVKWIVENSSGTKLQNWQETANVKVEVQDNTLKKTFREVLR